MTSSEQVIWTDNEQSRAILWDYYNGFLEHFGIYLMYRQLGRINPMSKAGLWRYTVNMYYEIKHLIPAIDNLNKVLGHRVGIVKSIINTHMDNGQELFEGKNLLMVREFFNDFMYLSGIKKIDYKRDTSNGIERMKKAYNIE